MPPPPLEILSIYRAIMDVYDIPHLKKKKMPNVI